MNIVDLRYIELRGRTKTETEVIVRGQSNPDGQTNDAAWVEAVKAFEQLVKCLAACKTSAAPVTAFT